MKNYILIILVVSLSFACANDAKKQIEPKQNRDLTTTKTSDPIQNTSNVALSLLKTTPLNKDTLLGQFPKILMDLNKTSASKGTMSTPNASSANAIYHGPDKKMMTIAITDCAGVDGAKLYKHYSKYKTKKVDTENSTATTTYFNKKGMEGKILFVKSLNQYAVDLLYKDRLAMTVGASNIELNKIWAVIEQLPLSELLNP